MTMYFQTSQSAIPRTAPRIVPILSSSINISLVFIILILILGNVQVNSLDLTEASTFKRLIQDVLLGLIIPDIHHSHQHSTPSTVSNEQVVPETLFIQFLESRLTNKPSTRTSQLAEDLVKALGQCIQTDSK